MKPPLLHIAKRTEAPHEPLAAVPPPTPSLRISTGSEALGAAEAAAESRSPRYRAGYLGFPPCSQQGREQRGCRATAQALRVTFPPARSSGFVPACSGSLRLPLLQPGFGAGNPTAGGASGLRLLGPFFHLLFPSGRGSSDPERWPRGPSERGERRSRAPPRLNAPQRGPPAFFLLPFPPSRGEISPLQTQPTERDRALGPPGKCHAGPQRSAPTALPLATPWGQGGRCRGGEILRKRFPGYLTKS